MNTQIFVYHICSGSWSLFKNKESFIQISNWRHFEVMAWQSCTVESGAESDPSGWIMSSCCWLLLAGAKSTMRAKMDSALWRHEKCLFGFLSSLAHFLSQLYSVIAWPPYALHYVRPMNRLIHGKTSSFMSFATRKKMTSAVPPKTKRQHGLDILTTVVNTCTDSELCSQFNLSLFICRYSIHHRDGSLGNCFL